MQRAFSGTSLRQRLLILLAVSGAVCLLVLFVFRQPIADWLWPQNKLQILNAQAEQALAAGKLTAADGTGARELYQAMLAMDPDQVRPYKGLANVAVAALDQTEQAMRANQLTQAHASLALAQELNAPRTRAQEIATRLRDMEAQHADIPALLSQAQAAYQSGHLVGEETSALALFQRVIALDPANQDALNGREDVVDDLATQARGHLQKNEIGTAATLVSAISKAYPGYEVLPELQSLLNSEITALKLKLDRAIDNKNPNAASDAYRRLVVAMPNDDETARYAGRIAQLYLASTQQYARDFEFARAEAALNAAVGLHADADQVADAKRVIANARQSKQQATQSTSHLSTAARTRQVEALLAQAKQAEVRGDLLTPPGESAFDKLKAAHALSPESRQVKQAMIRLLPSAQRCFERHLAANSLAQARTCLDAQIALGAERKQIRSSTHRLAQRWLEVAEQRLQAGDLPGARRAVDFASDIEPALTGLSSYEQRLRALGG